MGIKQSALTSQYPFFKESTVTSHLEDYIKNSKNISVFDKQLIEKSLNVAANQVNMLDFLDIVFGKSQGYICIAQKNSVSMRNIYYTKKQLAEKLPYLLDKSFGQDTYVAYSTFFNKFLGYSAEDSKKKNPVRIQENVQYTCMLAQDLDYYKIEGMNDQIAMQLIAEMVENSEILCPTFIVFTGRGIQLIWTVKPFKNIINYSNDRIWRAVQDKMISIFDNVKLNPDTVVKAPNAVTRLPETPNSKTKRTDNFTQFTLVKAFHVNGMELTLDDMSMFYGISPVPNKKVKASLKQQKSFREISENHSQPETPTYQNNVATLRNWNAFTLNRERENDVFKFVKIATKQGMNLVGKRTWLATFLVFHALVSSGGSIPYSDLRFKEYWELLEKLNISHDNSYEEMYERSRKAVDYYNDWVNDTWNKEKYVQGGLFYKTITILKYLEIEKDYYIQWHTKTLKIKNKPYEAARKRFERLAKGQVKGSKEEYNDKRSNDKQMKLQQLQELLSENPKIKRAELAEKLGVTGPRITQLKAELKKVNDVSLYKKLINIGGLGKD